MQTSSLSFSAAAAAVLAAVIVVASTAAQTPQSQAPAAGAAAQGPAGGPPGGPPREFPAPTNLKVLPKNLNGKQVRDIMEQWAGQLGVHCNACHAADPKGGMGPNGHPRLNFADDSKHEKQTARLMYTMTKKINADYISMVKMDHDHDEDHEHGAKGEHGEHEGHEAHNVTCGTCHRGHQHPEAFIPPPEHDGPPPPAK